MKRLFLIWLILCDCGLLLHAQEVAKGGHWNELKKISNKEADFWITNPVRIKDSTGKVVAVRKLVVLENKYMSKIANKYGKKLVPELVAMLNDSTRDWAANLLLYNITEQNATMLKYYPTSKLDEWKQEQKAKEIAKWKDYLKTNLK